MTLPMQRIIVADTSCLILLQKIQQLSLLRELFVEITITTKVAEELNMALPDFIKIQEPKDPNYFKILRTFLDEGEASVIALALEQEDCLLIIDETKGRKEAKSLGLTITGTLGVLLLAKEKKLIKAIKPLIQKIENTNFRISKALIEKALRMAQETNLG
jgi:predicted nucleic acid-binding protein